MPRLGRAPRVSTLDLNGPAEQLAENLAVRQERRASGAKARRIFNRYGPTKEFAEKCRVSPDLELLRWFFGLCRGE
jgi:hypothetical protein